MRQRRNKIKDKQPILRKLDRHWRSYGANRAITAGDLAATLCLHSQHGDRSANKSAARSANNGRDD
jgi:hypothetical protein